MVAEPEAGPSGQDVGFSNPDFLGSCPPPLFGMGLISTDAPQSALTVYGRGL